MASGNEIPHMTFVNCSSFSFHHGGNLERKIHDYLHSLCNEVSPCILYLCDQSLHIGCKQGLICSSFCGNQKSLTPETSQRIWYVGVKRWKHQQSKCQYDGACIILVAIMFHCDLSHYRMTPRAVMTTADWSDRAFLTSHLKKKLGPKQCVAVFPPINYQDPLFPSYGSQLTANKSPPFSCLLQHAVGYSRQILNPDP